MTVPTAYEAALARIDAGEPLRTYVPGRLKRPNYWVRYWRNHREASFMVPELLEGLPCANCYCLCAGAHVPGRYGRCACRCVVPAVWCQCGHDSSDHEWDEAGTACSITRCACLSFTPTHTKMARMGLIRRILHPFSTSRNHETTKGANHVSSR